MKSLKGTQTAQNLMYAFAGESQARNRYTYWSSIARKEGYVQIANIFEETANQEKEHAKRLMKFLNEELAGETVEITGSYPVLLGTTEENLVAAAAGENEEHTHMYPDFAKVAREEGFDVIATVFESIAVAEKFHEDRYLKLLADVRACSVFKKEESTMWKCNNCGFIFIGKEAPAKCPACAHPRDHFEVLTFFKG
ncbi:MAG: rubrerythrin family protein [Erysipelotrichaceae bacterium]|nr:rubrerythrin family protein [Erysipelotrichaceae bacterium]